jgi:nucleoside transporter
VRAEASAAVVAAPTALRTRLSTLMFLQFTVWGAWTPVLGKHLGNLGFTPVQIGAVYGTGALATMISPLLAGQIADRWLSAERLLATAFALASAFFFAAARTTQFDAMWWLSLGAMLAFAPTLGLANALCFHHLPDPQRQFPAVRVLGTVGWIAAGLLLGVWLSATQRPIGDCLNLAGVLAAATAGYCFTLPATPPLRGETFALGKALAMLKDPSFAVFSALAFVLMVFASFYYFRAANFVPTVGVSDAQLPVVMGIGQWAEIATMFALPAVYRRLGAKRTLLVGVAAWALRFGLFAVARSPLLVITAQALHGVSFAFGIAAAMIYVERVCPGDVRASAQSLLTWLTYGLGMFVGAWLGGFVSEWAHDDWTKVWSVPAIGCAVVLVGLAAGFRSRAETTGS